MLFMDYMDRSVRRGMIKDIEFQNNQIKYRMDRIDVSTVEGKQRYAELEKVLFANVSFRLELLLLDVNV